MIVMKFGGTSVQDAKAIDRVGQIVQGRLADRPVVVVSAMAKVTDALLAMGRAAGGGDRKSALKMARALRERHYETAGELLGTALFTEFHSGLGADFEDLDELLARDWRGGGNYSANVRFGGGFRRNAFQQDRCGCVCGARIAWGTC